MNYKIVCTGPSASWAQIVRINDDMNDIRSSKEQVNLSPMQLEALQKAHSYLRQADATLTQAVAMLHPLFGSVVVSILP